MGRGTIANVLSYSYDADGNLLTASNNAGTSTMTYDGNRLLTRTDPKESVQFIDGSWDSPADPRLSPERRAMGDMTHSVAVINACKPYHWRDKFPPSNAPSAAVARKAREKFGWLLDGGKTK